IQQGFINNKNRKCNPVLIKLKDETDYSFFFKDNPVDWNGRYETPAEKRGQGRPHRRKERRGGSRTARGKRVPGVEINVIRGSF
ncbi:hypothetical protein, partial [Peribacillus frigoritolerans]|uniref:hypothetical protein n=1 Tax=Peribacillus frigoritolerans TaxID=450367 RepID=UPI002E1DC831|nr:hypothetical protein [Peribacillus frigoritolerans]